VSVASTRVHLGNAKGALGDAAAQKECLEAALPVLTAHYGEGHIQLAHVLGALSNATGKLGDAVRQRALLQQALAIEEAQYGAEDPRVATTLQVLANAEGSAGDYSAKKALLERALAILAAACGIDGSGGSGGNGGGAGGAVRRDHLVAYANILANLGATWGTLGDKSKQLDLLERALGAKEKIYGPSHIALAGTLANLAKACGEKASDGPDTAKADAAAMLKRKRELLERCLELETAHYQDRSEGRPKLAQTMSSLGNACGALGDYEKQKEHLARALELKVAHYGPGHVQVGVGYSQLALACAKLGDDAKKTELLTKALALFQTHFQADHPYVLMCKEQLG
jgi:tetratricopeptide (TPR) repeat protein